MDLPSILILESDLVLIDRALLVGDIVKRSPRNTVSGTVIQAYSTAILLQPLKWRDAQRLLDDGEDLRTAFPLTPQNLLRDIPVDELQSPADHDTDDFVLCSGWVGKVTDVEEELHIRLANNSVVVPEDSQNMENLSYDGEIGDYALTTKGNLRRGRWIYGSYSARLNPGGFVAQTRPHSVEVSWLCSRYPTGGRPSPPEPPSQLDPEQFETGEVTIYRRRRKSGTSTLDTAAPKPNFEVSPVDKVRFKDLNGAALKYDGTTTHGKLNKIQRTDSLGYDTNVFLIVSSQTVVDVQWQDGSITRSLSTKSLIPFDVFDAQEELWPGEMVTTKGILTERDSVYHPAKVGIVQTVSAQDRIARMKWIPDASLDMTLGEEAEVLPGSFTGTASGEVEDSSFYDITPVTAIARRRGDFVICVSPPNGLDAYFDPVATQDLRALLEEPDNARSWFGEVIDLGLDGLLTIRLAAATPVRDVRVPWEATHLVWSSDQDSVDDETDDEDDDMSDSTFVDDTESSGLSVQAVERYNSILRGPRNSSADATEAKSSSSENSWETDEEDSDDEHDTTDGDISMGDDDGVQVDVIGATETIVIPDKDTFDEATDIGGATNNDTSNDDRMQVSRSLSYAAMFDSATKSNTWLPQHGRPVPFSILDGMPPDDHQWATEKHDLPGKVLRRIQKEQKILSQSLPEGAYVRTWEGALSCLRLMLLGPLDSPYEYSPFFFDFYLDSSFPTEPPRVHFHSRTEGQGACNPNLYEDGKVCLSLLGTWPGDDKGETWTSSSTLLQIIVSLLGLVLVTEPYYNEAGYEARVGSLEYQIPSALYSERVFLRSRAFIEHALRHKVSGFENDIISLYMTGPCLLVRAIKAAIDTIESSRLRQSPSSTSDRRVSIGALHPLIRQIESLISFVPEQMAAEITQHLQVVRVA